MSLTNSLVSRLRDEYVQQSSRCGEEDSQERALLAQEAADEIERLQKRLRVARNIIVDAQNFIHPTTVWRDTDLMQRNIDRFLADNPSHEPSGCPEHGMEHFFEGMCIKCGVVPAAKSNPPPEPSDGWICEYCRCMNVTATHCPVCKRARPSQKSSCRHEWETVDEGGGGSEFQPPDPAERKCCLCGKREYATL